MLTKTPVKIVSIGGGTGLSTLLYGLRPFVSDGSIELTAIVAMTDDGRSSGRLRNEFAIQPPGDIRSCLTALAPNGNADLPITKLFRHRFPGDGQVGGHSLGNLILLALSQINGSFLDAIETASKMLGIKARVLPSTMNDVALIAKVGDTTLTGQVAIKSQGAPINDIQLEPADAAALPEAVEAVLNADLITLGPGSLYTSVIAALLVKDLCKAVAESKAKKIYICNAMTEYDETDGFSAIDHVTQILAYAPAIKLDYALFNSSPISDEMRERYATERANAITPPRSVPDEHVDMAGMKFISLPLASEDRFVRHDPEKLSAAISTIFDTKKHKEIGYTETQR